MSGHKWEPISDAQLEVVRENIGYRGALDSEARGMVALIDELRWRVQRLESVVRDVEALTLDPEPPRLYAGVSRIPPSVKWLLRSIIAPVVDDNMTSGEETK